MLSLLCCLYCHHPWLVIVDHYSLSTQSYILTEWLVTAMAYLVEYLRWSSYIELLPFSQLPDKSR